MGMVRPNIYKETAYFNIGQTLKQIADLLIPRIVIAQKNIKKKVIIPQKVDLSQSGESALAFSSAQSRSCRSKPAGGLYSFNGLPEKQTPVIGGLINRILAQ